jgi:diguanylate cyclase (GGDEF)-like protein
LIRPGVDLVQSTASKERVLAAKNPATNTPPTPEEIGLAPARRHRPTAFAAAGLLLLLAMLAVAIVFSQNQSKSQVRSSFALRGKTSARFVDTYVSQQATREMQAAKRFLSAPHVSARDFEVVASTLGGADAVLLDSSGRVLANYPEKPSLRGQLIAANYSHLASAEQGRTAVSGQIYSPVDGTPATAVAIPYQSAVGRRVLSADYPAIDLALDALVDHTISYPQHNVYIVDGSERIVAASPRTQSVTLAQESPELARASAHATRGPVTNNGKPSEFTSTPVPGTSWRLLVEVPNTRLYASLAGWTKYVPWAVLALVSLLGTLLVLLFVRSLADRARLTTLSATMERTAQTDSLTGLNNRRALTEQLTRVAARARRHDEPLSVLMIDLDRFKQTNDTFGHEAGDQVLCTIADCMREVLRAGDIYGRWGGDEFLVALPLTNESGAKATAERLRSAACAVKLDSIGLSEGIPLSIGVASGAHTSPIELVREADGALYADKADGRTSGRGEQRREQHGGQRSEQRGDALAPR